MIFAIILWSIVILTLYTALICSIEFYILEYGKTATPWTLRDSTDLNWFGCWFWAIIIRILNPVWSIIYFVHWITHV